jgi:hypothetical protein
LLAPEWFLKRIIFLTKAENPENGLAMFVVLFEIKKL